MTIGISSEHHPVPVTETIRLEKFHQIPGKSGCKAKYPWRLMGVGTDFLARCGDEPAEIKKKFNSLTSCIANARRQTGFRFRMRRVPGGIRVWRVQ